jgi:hypothetical protein
VARATAFGVRHAALSVGRRWRSRGAAHPDDPEDLNVLFLGSTARSGTSVTARVLGMHPAYARIPIETKLISSPGGLCDLVRDRTTFRAFESRVRGWWFDRDPERGLHLIMDRDALDAALPVLRAGLRTDPWRAARVFIHTLFDPIAVAAGKPGWIEKFPANVRQAEVLYRIFPNMRLVHVVRDGRDVAASVVGFEWGPNEYDQALEWWARRLEAGFAACDRIPPERVHVVQVEDLIARNREHEYRRLLDFLGLDDDPAMRAFFSERVTAEKLHTGRWRHEVPAARVAAFDAHHDRLARQLLRRGRPYQPVLTPAEATSGHDFAEIASAAAD